MDATRVAATRSAAPGGPWCLLDLGSPREGPAMSYVDLAAANVRNAARKAAVRLTERRTPDSTTTDTSQLGHCLTGHHDQCERRVWLSMQQVDYECECECHG